MKDHKFSQRGGGQEKREGKILGDALVKYLVSSLCLFYIQILNIHTSHWCSSAQENNLSRLGLIKRATAEGKKYGTV